MRTLGVTANCGKERALHVLERVAARASALGIELQADPPTASLLGSGVCRPVADVFAGADAVMALGGDGTVLRTVREMGGRDIPVIGVNIGGLGFLTSVAEGDLDRALECLAAGDVEYSEVSTVEGAVERDGAEIARHRALNEVMIGRGPTSRVVTLDVSIDGDYVTSYVCDGLIVSTPCGSTGHSLSAGGPILRPDTPAFIISLICPHTLSSRPLVVPDRGRILVTAARSSGELLLSVDGQVEERLRTGDCLRVCRSPHRVRFIRLPGYSYFSVLRQKLHWSGSNV
jgi:NAD+ kinase